ncbi:MAG: alpha/beta fold hydrolase [Candidatus Sumerlaeia bacterium]|nr:alpha/beta fold hydrolase [Candidatus Sumerlaeia bacterium]
MSRLRSLSTALSMLAALAAAPAQDAAPAPETAADLPAVSQALVSGLFNGGAVELHGRFDDTMKAALPPQRLGSMVPELVRAYGAFQRADTATAAPLEQGGVQYTLVRFPLVFEKGELEARVSWAGSEGAFLISGLFFAPPAARADSPDSLPPYAVPANLVEHAVEVNGLTGRLTLPKTATAESPVPAVVLIHGSGPNDMDGKIGPNRPLRDLALGLGTYGVAVLRYHKRTYEAPGTLSQVERLTLRDEVEADALAALELLRARPEVDAARVFILGHSLGGALAPKIAAEDGRTAGVIVLAGTARMSYQIVLDQIDVVEASRGPEIDPSERAQFERLRGQLRGLADGTAEDPAEAVMGAPGYYWDEIMAIDTAGIAKALPVPVAVLYAGSDYQVPPTQAELWGPDFPRSDRDVLRVFPGLSHLMMAGAEGSPKDYDLRGHVDSQVVEAIALFILAR